MKLTIPKRARRRRRCSGSVSLIGVVVLSLVSGGGAQYTPPPPSLTTAPCQPTKKDPCAPPATQPLPPATADQFPFPGESKPAAPAAGPSEAFPFPGEAPDTALPTAGGAKPAQPGPGPSGNGLPSAPSGSGEAFPFPGEPPSAPPSSGSSSSSSSSSSASSSGAPDDNALDGDSPLKDEGSSGSTRSSRRHHLPKVEDMDKREATDVDVSHYYFSTGDYKAAYLRAKDAVSIYPDDEAAHLALAQSAERLGKRDEAAAEYGAFLKLDPDGPKSKAAQKAMLQLAPK